VLEGGAGNDRLAGLAGRDSLTGLGGDDELNALDAEQGDRVNCSDGVDRALLDAGDTIADDSCERSSWAPAAKTKRPKFSRGEIAVGLACPKEAPACRGSLTLRSEQGKAKELARGGYKIKGGKRSTTRMKPTKAGRSVLGRGKVEAELLVEPRGAEAPVGRSVTVR
jgi:Ca2+-binding RTX toxin-like protein